MASNNANNAKKQTKSKRKHAPTPTVCSGCAATFPSKSQLFKHLTSTDGACLSPKDHADFKKFVRSSTPKQKNVLLFGYIAIPNFIKDGDDAARLLLRAIRKHDDEEEGGDDDDDRGKQGGANIATTVNTVGSNSGNRGNSGNNTTDSIVEKNDDPKEPALKKKPPAPEDSVKINRSYGTLNRDANLIRQDQDTGAITELLAVKIAPLQGSMTNERWVDETQTILEADWKKRCATLRDTSQALPDFSPLRLLARLALQHNKFNAEMDMSHRRNEYIVPLCMLRESVQRASSSDLQLEYDSMEQTIPEFVENHRHSVNHETDSSFTHPNARQYFLVLKRIMQTLTTRIVEIDINDQNAVAEKQFHLRSRKRLRQKPKRFKGKPKRNKNDPPVHDANDDGHNNDNDNEQSKPESPQSSEEKADTEKEVPMVASGDRMLQRKRFHNFTPRVMAHHYLAYRRLDRLYHRSTLRYPLLPAESKLPTATAARSMPFLVLSLKGDLFLEGQVCRLIGVLVALANGIIDPDFVDCVFDESYPHLIPTPPAPNHAMMAAEAYYISWEGKAKAILNPRSTDRYEKGFNSDHILQRVQEWQSIMYQRAVDGWLRSGVDSGTGDLCSVRKWFDDVLVPWSETAKEQLQDYRKWKLDTATIAKQLAVSADGTASEPTNEATSADDVDATVPQLYEAVLHYLRLADKSGQWPSTTSKRQLVMVSDQQQLQQQQEEKSGESNGNGDQSQPQRLVSSTDSLSLAFSKAKHNKHTRSSAYSFAQGQGGASGSFSVGAMPGGINKQPKANSMFPELVEAAFALERKLRPNREPSSTIAINRNAQFRPHTDSGAGAGQSTSLIVGLGTYSGGELVVEGAKHDIRYKGLEFNGWTQRHWTMPFVGERYSLVWFTPKGCEGLRGIDLDLEAFKSKQ